MEQPEGQAPDSLQGIIVTNAELEALCKNAYVAGWNASQNFNHIGVSEGWKSWLEYVAQTGGLHQ